MPRRSIGKLRRHFSIQTRSTTKDNLGEPVNTYTETFRCFGHIKNGRQQVKSEVGLPVTEDTLLLTTHYRAGFKAGGLQRAVDLQSNRTYRIDSVMDVDERRQWITAIVVEIPVEFPQ